MKNVLKGLVLLAFLAANYPMESVSQLAKIQRKYATFTVQPDFVAVGNITFASIQPWTAAEGWNIRVFDEKSKEIFSKKVEYSAVPQSVPLEFSEVKAGRYRILLEAKMQGEWEPVAEQFITLEPAILDKVLTIKKQIEQIEKDAKENIRLQQSCWAVLATIEDIQERLKSDGANAPDLKNRLDTAEKYLKSVQAGNDPYEGKTGYQLRGYRSPVTGEIQLYSLYVPKDYSPDKEWPFVVMLHGATSNHHLALRRVMGKTNRPGEDDPAAKRSMPDLPNVPYIVVAPNGFETMGYMGLSEDDVWRVMDEAESLFKIDANRVYLTGLSMGGGGTGKLGFRYPDRFAAIAPVCGYFNFSNRTQSNLASDFADKLYQSGSILALAENMLHVPVKLMHGDADPVVSPKESESMYKSLKELGYKTELELFPGVGHDAWDPGYKDARIFSWFSQFKRNPAPAKVIFKTGDSQGGSAYWVKIMDLQKIREFAKVEAEIKENRLSVKTQNAAWISFTVPFSLIAEKQKFQVQLDGQEIIEFTQDGKEIDFQNDGQKWSRATDPWIPKLLPNRYGLDAARKYKHIYIYGSAGSEEETAVARTLAELKSMQGGTADVLWPVCPEDDFSKEEAAKNNVVLFSTFDGSRGIAEFINDMPLKKTEKGLEFAGRAIEKDQAFSFIYPNPLNPQKYVMVNVASSIEGLKALTRFASGDQMAFLNIPSGDFVCFDKDGTPLWGGLFNKNWQVDMMGDFRK